MRRLRFAAIALATALAGAATGVVQDQCGPFTDVSASLCPFVLEMYVLGITAGTSPTTYSPSAPLTRGQAAVFVSRAVNQSIARSSDRAARGQWWNPTPLTLLARTNVGSNPFGVASDGSDVWVTNHFGAGIADVSRVRASDGRLLETWSGAHGAYAIAIGLGRVVATSQRGFGNPHQLYAIDPADPSLQAKVVVPSFPNDGIDILFDGGRFWVRSTISELHIVTPTGRSTWDYTTVTGFDSLSGMFFDGRNVWVVEVGGVNGWLLRLGPAGEILQRFSIGKNTGYPAFDGENIWIPNTQDHTISVVRASTGKEIALLETDLNPYMAAFDGERMAILQGLNVTVWRAADLKRIGSAPARGVQICSGGGRFWVSDNTFDQVVGF